MRRIPGTPRNLLAVSLLAIGMVATVGCGSKSVGRSLLSTTIGDREIRASLDGGAFISSQDDAAILNFGGGKLIVEKDRVQLAGHEIAKLSHDAKKIEIDYSSGKLTVTADGETVYSSELKK